MDNSNLSVLKADRKSSGTYVVATAFLALFAIVGFAWYGLPFFFDFMTKEYGWSRTVVTSGNAVGKLIVAPLFGFIAGWLIDRHGPRRLMMAGAIFMGTALIGLSFSDNLPMFYSFYVLNALGYLFGGPLPCQVMISRWFDKNRGKAMGIAYLGIAAGGAVVPIIANNVEQLVGWHNSLMIIGMLIILIAFPMAFFLRDPETKANISKAKGKPAESVPMKHILKSRNFYLLAIGSMCSIGAVGGTIQHLKLYLTDINYTQSQSAYIMSLVLFSSLFGRVLMGFLADWMNRKYVMVLIYMIVALAIPLLLVPDFPGRIYIFAVIFGIGLGGDYMIIPLMAGDLFGIRVLGRTMGIILVSDGASEALFPMLVGALYNTETESYLIGFLVLIGVALIGAICVSFLPKTKVTRGLDGDAVPA